MSRKDNAFPTNERILVKLNN